MFLLFASTPYQEEYKISKSAKTYCRAARNACYCTAGKSVAVNLSLAYVANVIFISVYAFV